MCHTNGKGAPDDRRMRRSQSGRPDSNRRPSPWQGDALPTELRPHDRILGSCRGRYWDRTSDLFRVKEARYPCANRPKVLATHLSGLEESYMDSWGVRTNSSVTCVPLLKSSAPRGGPAGLRSTAHPAPREARPRIVARPPHGRPAPASPQPRRHSDLAVTSDTVGPQHLRRCSDPHIVFPRRHGRCADVAQLVEHHLAKVRVAGSNPVVRSIPSPASSDAPGDWRSGSALP